jgi:ubiquinone/menaquinone biosynthesis C-methylase UbiE
MRTASDRFRAEEGGRKSVGRGGMSGKQRFDDWPERYDRWFETPVGKAVLKYETELILEMLRPGWGERILDAGSGTGIFTREFLVRGAKIVGLDISLAMLVYAAKKAALQQVTDDKCPMPARAEQAALRRAQEETPPMSVLVGEKAALRQAQSDKCPMPVRVGEKASTRPYRGVTADMASLPFADGSFDKSVSVAALEFVADEKRAVAELFRVTKPGGVVVVATLNSLGPWAARRSANARRDPESIFNRVFFRSPAQLLAATLVSGIVRTAVHFGKEDDPTTFDRSEREGEGLDTGAFVAARWLKP